MDDNKTQSPLSDAELELRRLELENRKREIELPVELASLGLRGTLSGAIAGVVLLLILAGFSTFSDGSQITGTHLCIMLGIICTTVAFYGAFVFQRSLKVSAARDKGFSAEATKHATGENQAQSSK